MAKRKRWVDCPGEKILPGDYIRQILSYPNTVIHRAEWLAGDLIHCAPVKRDGTRDRRWAGGMTGGVHCWVKVRSVPAEG